MLQKDNTRFYKDIRIEDFFDIYFYHPLGFKIALFFKNFNFSPTFVSIISMIIGVLGGLLIYKGYFIFGSIFVVLSSVFDSADGQLARMRDLSSNFGRIIDGLCGYIVFISVYIALYFRFKDTHGELSYLLIMFFAGFSNIVQNSIYDFYRTSFIAVKEQNYSFLLSDLSSKFLSLIYGLYIFIQRILLSRHIQLLNLIKLNRGQSFNEIKKIYEETFLPNIQLVNILGDNWKINGLIMLSLVGRIDLFFWYVAIVLNLILIIVIFIQRKNEKLILNIFKERL
ncbi:MAG: CDP-alcohol phosphatidyltransferase family protein [Elusimicrobiales bacterium]|nr:CDP-alcohol phosphatidyltransferase family protein [Elusimicrobiales bacterium]